MANAFYFTSNVLSVIKIFKFLQFFFFLPNILGWVVKMEAKVGNGIIMTSWIVLHQIINCNFWTIQKSLWFKTSKFAAMHHQRMETFEQLWQPGKRPSTISSTLFP